MKVVLVTGSRHWNDEAPIRKALEGAELLIVGDCPDGRSEIEKAQGKPMRSADAIAVKVAREWDIIIAAWPKPTSIGFEAQWHMFPGKTIGNPAGPLRNGAMAERFLVEHSAGMDCTLAAYPMPGSKGTVDCMNQVLALMPWLSVVV